MPSFLFDFIIFNWIRLRIKFGHLRKIEKEETIEQEITKIIRDNFSFRFIIMENEEERIGSKGLEGKFIGTLTRCEKCKPSPNWLGNYSPKIQIRKSGLWLTQHLNAEEINNEDVIEKLIDKTKKWVESRE